ncbi:hypothetical protein DYH10_01935 [Candidatus Saccharibacteria bacterium CPR2]|nr:hypothetical protein [Candidatus Saccharibacteria bacterium CPR2]
MLRIDENLLDELGLVSLPKEDKRELLGQLYETLQLRVGMKLAEQMSDTQLEEFDNITKNQRDEKVALQWLETNLPNYKQVVYQELERLKEEIKKDADKIVQAVKEQREQ